MLGIDVSKPSLECALLDRPSEEFQWRRSYQNTQAGIAKLLADTPADVPWVLEPTGRYSRLVVQQGRAAGRTVLLAPPRRAKAYLASVNPRAKTDKLDCGGLAWFAATRPKAQRLREYPINPESVERVEQLLTARKGVVQAITSLRQRVQELPFAAESLEAAITGLEAERANLDTQIAGATREVAPKTVARLQQVVGIGPVTAAAITARLTARKFARADHFVAYLGLDVATFSSGKRQGERGLTKQGDAELRRLLYLCAQSAVRSTRAPFRNQYQEQIKRGRKKTEALCIVARKLAKLCWSLVTYEQDYKPERVYEPANPPKAKGDAAARAAGAGTEEPPLPSAGTAPAEVAAMAPHENSPLDTNHRV